jgi:hypothetical protein
MEKIIYHIIGKAYPYPPGLPPSTAHHSNHLLRKIHPGTVQLRLEVIHISSNKHKRAREQSNKDRCRSIQTSRTTDNSTILAHNLDSLHEVTCVVVGVLDVRVREVGLALSRVGIKLLAHLLDLVGICLIIGIVLVLAVLVDFLGFLARQALGSNQGGVGVRKSRASEGSVGGGACISIGELGACLFGEKTKVDATTVLRAVGTKVVGSLGVLELTTVVVVLDLELSALSHLTHFLFLILVSVVVVAIVLLIGVLVNAVFHTLAHVAIILAVFRVEVIALVLAIAGTVTVVLLVLAIVFLILLDSLEVCLKIVFHTNDVVSISSTASGGILHGARRAGTEAEAHKTLSADLDVLVAVGLTVPSLGVVASLELEAHVGNPGVGNLFIGILEATGFREDVLANSGGGGDGGFGGDLRGGREAEGGGEDGGGELHDAGGI